MYCKSEQKALNLFSAFCFGIWDTIRGFCLVSVTVSVHMYLHTQITTVFQNMSAVLNRMYIGFVRKDFSILTFIVQKEPEEML